MSRELLENAAINVGYCDREMEKARVALEAAQINLARAKTELIERALAFRTTQPLGMPAMPAPPPTLGQPMPGSPPSAWGKS